jgi:sugar lactone lactonase YvrE
MKTHIHKRTQRQNTATVKISIRRSPWRSAFLLIVLAASTALAPVGLRAAPGDIFASVNGNNQDGGGFVYKYTPTGVQSTFASGLSRPRGVAFDTTGNLFVANTAFDGTTYQATIVKIKPRGVQSTFATLSSSNFFAEGLAFDSSGNLFVAAGDPNDPNFPSSPSTIFKFTPDGAESTFGSVPGLSFGLAFDSAGNLCVPDGGGEGRVFQAIWKFTPDGTKSVFVGPCAFCALPPVAAPVGLAFDRFGNLFVSTPSSPDVLNGDSILKFTPDGVGSTFATGLNHPRGLAFDRGGNLFVAEIRQDGPGDILKFTPDGNMTVFASGIGPGANGGPEFVAIQPRRH